MIRVLALEDDHRAAFAFLEEIAIKGPEGERALACFPDQAFIGNGKQLNEKAIKLNEPVGCSPRVARFRRDRKAKGFPGLAGGIEIADGNDQMIQSMYHAAPPPIPVSLRPDGSGGPPPR